MPFTVDQFFDVFEAYNIAIWPAQIIAYALGIAAIVLAIRESDGRSRIASGIIALFWVWMGAVYHVIYFGAINPLAEVFGAFFILQGVLVAVTGSASGRLRFGFSKGPIQIIGAVFVLYAMILYSLIGNLFGHAYPRSPVFGVAPCPATIFTLGLFLWASRPVPIYLLIIPFLWSLVGLSAAIHLQVYQDFGLGVAGVLGTAFILWRNRKLKPGNQ